MAKEIKKVPDRGVTGLSISRVSGSALALEAKWNVPKQLTDDTDHRATGYYIRFKISCVDNSGKKKVLSYERTAGDASRSSWTLNLNAADGIKLKPTDTKAYKRSVDFWPANPRGLRITSVTAWVCPYNTKGSSGKWVSRTFKFEVPGKPSISALSMSETEGTVTVTVKHGAGQGVREIYVTHCWMGVWDSRKNDGKGAYIQEVEWDFYASQETSSRTVDIAGRMGLYAGDHISVFARAWSRGIRGQSEKASRDLYVSYPWAPEIDSVGFGSVSKEDLTDNTKATVWCHTNVTTTHPVTGLKLQVLRNSEYDRASQLSAEDWLTAEDVAQDNGKCSALSALVGSLRSNEGLYTWIRLKSWNMFEGIYYRFSKVRRLDEVFHALPVAPTAADDPCAIASAVTGMDGSSVDLVLAFNSDGDTGTELSWSDSDKAWHSTKEPKTYNVTWSEGTPITVGNVTYARQAKVNVPDLEEGTRYYFRARRYLEGEDDTTYGPYDRVAGYVSCTPTSAPESVTLLAHRTLPRGSDLQLSWSHEGSATQTRWELITGETRTETDYDGREHLYIRGDTDGTYKVVSVADGSDARGSYVVEWDRIKDLLDASDSVALAVRVGTGGDTVTSEAVLVTIADAPTLAVAASALTARPQTLSLSCSTNAEVALTVLSQGVSGDYPDGSRAQERGDTAWTMALTPDWTATTDTVDGETQVTGWTAQVAVPYSAPLLDGGRYTVVAVATDPDTGMASDEATCEFAVNYARKSPGPPEDGVVITPYDTTDPDTGWRTRGCRITLASLDYNRGEWFRHDITDTEYWASMPSVGVTAEDDGWALVSVALSSGLEFATNDEASGTYLIEWRGLSSSVVMSLGDEVIDTSESTGSATVVGGAGEVLSLAGSNGGSLTVYAHLRVTLYADERADVYDVYRLTPDGADLVAEGIEHDTTVDDQYAPFGSDGSGLAYRVAVRTADGCEGWIDYPYELDGDELRVDWDGGYVELPYNLSLSGQWGKPFKRRRHFEGAVEGYWDEGATYDEGLSTDLIRVGDPATARAVRELGAYCGPVLVRTPDGRCYEANVDVKGYGMSYDNGGISVALDAARVDLTEAHMATLPMPEETYTDDDEEVET